MVNPDLRIEMRCIVYCDIVGYTSQCVAARQEKREESFNAKTARFVEVWRERAATNGAAFMKSLGDGLLATFSDPVAAMHAVTESMRAALDDVHCADLCARVGMHVGKVCIQADGDILGADVALGQRILTQAKPGQVVMSETCASHLKPYLPVDHTLQDLGDRRLKGFDKPVRVFRLYAPCLPIAAIAPSSGQRTGDGPTRVLLVVSNTNRHHDLVHTLQALPAVDVVGHAHDAGDAIEKASALNPDVLLMDLDIAGMDTIEAIRNLKEACPDTEALAIADVSNDIRIAEAYTAGAIGFLLSGSGVDEVNQALQAARRKEACFSDTLASLAISKFQQIKSANKDVRSLFAEWNKRERDLLTNLTEATSARLPLNAQLPNDQVVREQMTNILSKLQINERTEPVLQALRKAKDIVTPSRAATDPQNRTDGE